ncbi:response regulator transcription factor [Paracoccus hibiscisoli]|uniref:Response regulator transcription factor n=1 Tax=Paracoccus hibiscisoli TaxID=2023261 RepID=A0A4U0QR13_9RHOB|nr:response regulator transcription factor [Paracoccus hibiscisoli]TJZ84355.1 response regulator transcription factor [Paracoccus hibiscisoli]
MDILIVEDDPEIAAFLVQGLTVEGYAPHHVATGAAMQAALDARRWCLVILDRMLPDAEGADLCTQLRRADPGQLILMLTARDALEEKLDGLRSGADDYMTKPFAFEELLVRIETLRRRGGSRQEAVQIADLTLNLALKSAARGGRDLGLTPTEFALLRFLVERRGTIVSRMEILAGVWGKSFDPNTNLVEVYIAYLRKKVDGPGAERLIRNVRGFGYVIDDD